MTKKQILLNTLFWGFILWLFGYVLGIVFFAFAPKEQIGFYILPLGVALTLWVLFKKIKREEFTCLSVLVSSGQLWPFFWIIFSSLKCSSPPIITSRMFMFIML